MTASSATMTSVRRFVRCDDMSNVNKGDECIPRDLNSEKSSSPEWRYDTNAIILLMKIPFAPIWWWTILPAIEMPNGVTVCVQIIHYAVYLWLWVAGHGSLLDNFIFFFLLFSHLEYIFNLIAERYQQLGKYSTRLSGWPLSRDINGQKQKYSHVWKLRNSLVKRPAGDSRTHHRANYFEFFRPREFRTSRRKIINKLVFCLFTFHRGHVFI